jgi:hypothetical protein
MSCFAWSSTASAGSGGGTTTFGRARRPLMVTPNAGLPLGFATALPRASSPCAMNDHTQAPPPRAPAAS